MEKMCVWMCVRAAGKLSNGLFTCSVSVFFEFNTWSHVRNYRNHKNA